ncbi:MAG: hypothetical protein QM607_06435 [Microbacterium sp.]
MTTDEGGQTPSGILLAFVVVGYGALLIGALGFLSLLTDSDVIRTPGVPNPAGVLAVLVAVVAFALALWPPLRRTHPNYPAALGVALITGVAYGVALWLLALVFGADLVTATAALGGVVTSWPIAVIVLAAALGGWIGIALRRTRAHRPHWPWE